MANYRLSIGKYLLSILPFFVLQLCLCSQHFSFLAKAQCFLGRTKDRLYLHRMLFSGWTRLQLDSVVFDSTADLWYQAFSMTHNIGSRSEPCQTKAEQKIWQLLEASDKVCVVAGYQKVLLIWSVFKGLGEGWRNSLTLMDRRIHFCP